MSPRRVTLFIWLCIAMLALLCAIYPSGGIDCGEITLHWPGLQRVLGTETTGNALATTDSLTFVEADTMAQDVNRVHHIPTPLSQTSGTLPHLRQALATANTQHVNVIHYGDSQIEEDRITSIIRHYLQSQYGGGGVGLIPLHQTIPTYSLKQRLYIGGIQQSIQQGPMRYIVYGPRSWHLPDADHHYGPMGQVAMMNDSLVPGSEDIYLTVKPLQDKHHPILPHSIVRTIADTSIHTLCIGDTIHLHGQGRVYGLSLETPTGVSVDNVPMRGCLGTIFTQMDSAQLSDYYRQANTRLIILQYGGNAIPQNKQESTIRGICYSLRDQVRYLREVAPDADILFIGPSDMIEMSEDGELRSNPMVALMDATLSELLSREQVPYFSLYRAMGGAGSMIHWQDIGWAGADGIHFTRSGANRAAKLLIEWLEPMLKGSDNTNNVNNVNNVNNANNEPEQSGPDTSHICL